MKEWELETCCEEFKNSVLDGNDGNIKITTSVENGTIYLSLNNDSSTLNYCPYCGKKIEDHIKVKPIDCDC